MKATANGSGIAAPVSAASAPNLITIDITPTIERDYKRREVFAELRLDSAARIVNGATGRYEVTIERARAVYADAEHMRWGTMALPRGLACAYRALWHHVGRAITGEERRGLWEDPGIDEMRKRAEMTPARLEVGEQILYFSDDDADGLEGTIVQPFALYRVLYSDEKARYVDKEGSRAAYRHGYVIRRKGRGKETDIFVPAHELTRDDCMPSHLCLATVNGALIAQSGACHD